MSAAEKFIPLVIDRAIAEARAGAVAKFRELADKLESGELHGARVQWREGLDYVEFVEATEDRGDGKGEVRLRQVHFETGSSSGDSG